MAAETRRTSDHEGPAVQRAVGEGRTLAATMPRLILEARRVAASIIHGMHGRRRAGPGENFWQYRRFVSGEPASRVDWRRSARDDHLYVRELEWEAAHTIWIWPDRSPSMLFASQLAHDNKLRSRAGGRAGARRNSGRRRRARGHSRTDASDRQPQRDRAHGAGDRARSRRTHEPAAEFRALPAVRDRAPVRLVEPTSPISDARSRNSPAAARAGMWCRSSIRPKRPFRIRAASNSSSRKAAAASPPAGRETWRADYEGRVRRHRSEIRAETDRLSWSFTIHRTDRPASELLLALHARIGAALSDSGPRLPRARKRGPRHDRWNSARLRRTAGADRAAEHCRHCGGCCGCAAAPAPHRFSADAAADRHRARAKRPRPAHRGG